MLAAANVVFKSLIHHLNYSTLTSTTDSYVTYLVHSFGFPRQQALSVSNNLTLRIRRKTNKVIDSKFVENSNSVGTLFRNLGFHQTHIRNIVSKEPRLLASKVDTTLKPKIRALQNEDFSASDIIRVISRRPEMLSFGLESSILPAIHILKQVMGSVDNVVQAIQRINKNYFRDIVKCLLPNVALLNSYGLPIDFIRKQLLNQPCYYLRNPEIFKEIVIRTPKKLEITSIQVYAINVISGMCGKTFESESHTFKSFGAKYLVDLFGFSHEQALSISTKLTKLSKNKDYYFKYFANVNSVVTLFRNLHFRQTVIRNIVSKEPRLLTSNADERFKPKIRALRDEDFSQSHIIRVISTCPAILLLSFESTILPAIHILKQVMGSVGNVVAAIERLRKGHFSAIVRSLLPNVTLLSSFGVPIKTIREQLLYQPWCYVQNPEVFKDIVMRVIKLGIAQDSPMFLHCIQLTHIRSEETVLSKILIFKSFGWTQSDIETFIMKNGCRLAFSDGRIKKLEFLMNELRLMPACLKSQTGFITRSLEKTIAPRHKILMILKEKGLVEKNRSLYNAIQMSESCFVKRFVLPFKEVHEDYAKLTGCNLKLFTQEKAVVIS